MDLKIDYGTVQVARLGDSQPLFAAIDGRVCSLGGDESVFYDPTTDRSHVMTSQVLQALNMCREFQPMDRHVQHVCEQLPNMQGQQAGVRRVLDSLATRGLLIGDDAFALRLAQSPTSSLAPMAGLFIRACDRPAQLRALLESLSNEAEQASLMQRIVVVDDSRSSKAIDEHARTLRTFAASWQQPVHHVTPARWLDVINDCASELPEHERVLRSLLSHDPTYHGRRGGGQGRNLITLLAAGGRYILLDDDNLFPLRQHAQGARVLGAADVAWRIHSFSDHSRALGAGVDAHDALATQLAICGRHIGELVAAGQITIGRDQLRGMAPSRDLLLRGGTRVGMTVNGHRGASCASGFDWMLLLDSPAREGFADTDANYLARRGDPAVWFGCRMYSVTRSASFTPFAVDNGSLMPCTSPFGRGEDAVFNALAGLGDEHLAHLHVPWSIGHRPEAGRDRSESIGVADTPDVNLCLTELIGHVAGDLHAESRELRYRLMAARLDELAGGSDSTVVSYLREYLVYRRASLVSRLQVAIQAAGDAPGAMQSDIKTQIEANGRAIIERGVPRFAGWPQSATASECAAAFRSEAQTLAAGLRAWPQIWEVATKRNTQWLAHARVQQ